MCNPRMTTEEENTNAEKNAMHRDINGSDAGMLERSPEFCPGPKGSDDANREEDGPNNDEGR